MEYESYIQIYSKKMLYNNNTIKEKRKTGTLKSYDGFSINVLKHIINELNVFDYHDYEYLVNSDYSHRDSKWKIVDMLYKDNKIVYKPDMIKPPVYNIIIFDDNVEYLDKSFIFSDDESITPKYGKYIFFDSREAYKFIGPSQNTKYIIIKFY